MRRASLSMCLALLVMLASGTAGAADAPLAFPDAAQQARYHALLKELRCLVCQNQSLEDSHAELAQDLRAEVHGMISAGKSDREILDFMVARYGDFVLYRPPVRESTWLLWFGPFLLLVVAVGAALAYSRGRGRTVAPPLTDGEAARLRGLVGPDAGRDAP